MPFAEFYGKSRDAPPCRTRTAGLRASRRPARRGAFHMAQRVREDGAAPSPHAFHNVVGDLPLRLLPLVIGPYRRSVPGEEETRGGAENRSPGSGR